MSSSASDKPTATALNKAAVWQWVTLCFGLVGALALSTAHLPPGWQRPGPTAFWFAVVSGVAVGWIAIVNHIRSRWLVFSVAFFIISLAIAGMSGERYRLYAQSLRDLYLGPLAAKNLDSVGETWRHGPAMEIIMDDIREARRQVYETKRPFPVFLKFRVEGLGIAEQPWPLVFWMGEIFGGGLVGGFIAMRWHTWQMEREPTKSESG